MKRPPIHGLMAEFDSPTLLVHATRRAHEEGYRKMDAYTPFPIEELSDAIGFRHTRLPMPYHPVFNVKSLALASKDKFFLCIEAADPKYDRAATQKFLESLAPREIAEVPH